MRATKVDGQPFARHDRPVCCNLAMGGFKYSGLSNAPNLSVSNQRGAITDVVTSWWSTKNSRRAFELFAKFSRKLTGLSLTFGNKNKQRFKLQSYADHLWLVLLNVVKILDISDTSTLLLIDRSVAQYLRGIMIIRPFEYVHFDMGDK